MIGKPTQRGMDWNNPLRSIAATVDADVLQALAGAHEPVTGNQLARLAGRSYAQVYAVVGRMVGEGLVLSQRYGRTNTYRLNGDHVLTRGILRVLGTPALIETEIRQLATGWEPQAFSIAFLGSAARRETPADGDVEVLVIRSDAVSERNPAWHNQLGDMVKRLEDLSGNQVRLTDVVPSELQSALSTDGPLAGALSRGARTIFGEDPRVFTNSGTARSAPRRRDGAD